MKSPLISVIVPCYNQAAFLADAVESIRRQTYTKWECLIINDGSKDRTKEIATAMSIADTRVRVVNQTNTGLAGARNRGLKESGGDFVQFLDADDTIRPMKFEKHLEKIGDSHALNLSYSDYYKSPQNELNTEIPEYYVNPKLRSNDPLKEIAADWETRLSIPCHSFFIDRRLFARNASAFDPTLRTHEDWDCWLQLLSQRPVVTFIDEKLAVYRIQDSSMCRDMRKMRTGFLRTIDKQIERFADDPAMLQIFREKRREIAWNYRRHSAFHPSAVKIAIKRLFSRRAAQ